MSIAFPFHIGPTGGTAFRDEERHIKDLIELILFTSKGERVNRPTYGANIRQLIFSENVSELAGVTEHLVISALQENLSDKIEIRGVEVESIDATIKILVKYRVLTDVNEKQALFVRSV